MVKINNKKISSRQLQALVIIQSLGTSLVLIPVFARANIINLIFAGLLNIIYTLFITRLGGCGISELASRHGNVFAKVIALAFAVKLILTEGMALCFFSRCTNKIMLSEMNIYIISAFMLFCAAYGACKGIEVIGRSGEILFWFVLLPVVFVYAMGIKNCDISNFDTRGFSISNILPLGFCFGGAELTLLGGEYALGGRRGMEGAVALSVLITAVVAVISVLFYGKTYFLGQDFGVLEMMYSAEKVGFFIHRQEALVMCFWVTAVFFGLMLNLFFVSDLISKCFTVSKNKVIIPVCIFMFAVSLVFANINNIFYIEKYAGLFFVLLLPAILRFGGERR